MKRNVLIIVFVLGLIIYCFLPGKYNSKYKLNIISSYGADEAYHPKILNFNKKWNGYKYWMSYTPYPLGNDSKENPHLVVSNDLVTWHKLYKIDRALDEPASNIPLKRYNSDSHIVYNSKLDRMEIYWRYVDDIKGKVYIYRMTSKDGVNWSDKEISLQSERRKKDWVSPAIIYEDGLYKMWFLDSGFRIKYADSKDGLHWENEKVINFKYKEKVYSWHQDVIKTEYGYEMIVVAMDSWKNHNNMNLYYSKSKDGINWSDATVILKPTKGTLLWDNRGIYRSSFIKENGVYFVYYGGTNNDLHHGLGLVYGKDINNLKSTNVDFDNPKDCKKLIKDIKREMK